MEGQAVIRVILADDHHLVRKGLRSLLEKEEGIQVVGEAQDGQEALDLVAALSPEVIVMDIAMPGLNGLQAAERVSSSYPETRVIILSMHRSSTLVQRALRSGVRGYLLKDSITEELLLAIRAAAQNRTYLSPSISDIILGQLLNKAPCEESSLDQLTPREVEVLQLIAEGNTNPAIAERLHITSSTVERHRANLMAKLDIHDVAGLTRFAIRTGLIFIED